MRKGLPTSTAKETISQQILEANWLVWYIEVGLQFYGSSSRTSRESWRNFFCLGSCRAPLRKDRTSHNEKRTCHVTAKETLSQQALEANWHI